MSSPNDSIASLSRALDQTGDVLAAIHREQLSDPTPCPDWDMAHLIGHVLADAPRFTESVRGGDPDWSAPPVPVSATTDWAAQFRSDADDLIHAWHQKGAQVEEGDADWQIAEFAVHTWDLVRASGQDRVLDPEVAERGIRLDVEEPHAGEPSPRLRSRGRGARRRRPLRPHRRVRRSGALGAT